MKPYFEKLDKPGHYELHGPLNYDTVTDLHEEYRPLFIEPHPIQLDLRGVTQVDSAGLAFFVGLARDAQREGDMMIFVGASDELKAMIKMADLESLFQYRTGW